MQREEMLRLVRRVADELGIHVLLSSHLLEEVERVADAVIILDQGRTVATGNVAELQAGSGPVEIMVTFDGDTDKFMASLKTKRVAARALEGGGRVLVTVTNDATFDKVRDAIATAKLSLRSMKRQRETLEDVFFAASEHEDTPA
jgi:ABC-2 type transport system ATP-binding protein